jgi:hypothetical protein
MLPRTAHITVARVAPTHHARRVQRFQNGRHCRVPCTRIAGSGILIIGSVPACVARMAVSHAPRKPLPCPCREGGKRVRWWVTRQRLREMGSFALTRSPACPSRRGCATNGPESRLSPSCRSTPAQKNACDGRSQANGGEVNGRTRRDGQRIRHRMARSKHRWSRDDPGQRESCARSMRTLASPGRRGAHVSPAFPSSLCVFCVVLEGFSLSRDGFSFG